MTFMNLVVFHAAIAARGRPAHPVILFDQATYEKKVSRFWTGLSEELGAEFGAASALSLPFGALTPFRPLRQHAFLFRTHTRLPV